MSGKHTLACPSPSPHLHVLRPCYTYLDKSNKIRLLKQEGELKKLYVRKFRSHIGKNQFLWTSEGLV